MKQKAYIIGSGFSSLSAACYLAKSGYDVTVLEKNEQLGGRAQVLRRDGFRFDMGPTWYWMPDVFEKFFADFGKHPSQYYHLQRLSPAYSAHFNDGQRVDIGSRYRDIRNTFEGIETSAAAHLDAFMVEAKDNYVTAIGDLVYRPGESVFELVGLRTLRRIRRFFTPITKDIRGRFKDARLKTILEFPVLFLGAKPADTPSFYSFMNYADFGMGTWYPQRGMYTVVEAMVSLATELGVSFQTNAQVQRIEVKGNRVSGLKVGGQFKKADLVVSGADYYHTEKLLEEKFRHYSEKYWDSRTFAPSALLFYIGFDKKLQDVNHHMLFFDADFEQHAQDIYDHPRWPDSPVFYASFPSVTDSSCAPHGQESAIILVPLALGLTDNEALRKEMFDKIIQRLEKNLTQPLSQHVVFWESFGSRDFCDRYNSYKGNAYGMANTLKQTAFLRPGLRSRKVKNLFFTGQLTVPGPGIPPALISGKLVASLVQKYARP